MARTFPENKSVGGLNLSYLFIFQFLGDEPAFLLLRLPELLAFWEQKKEGSWESNHLL